MQTGSKIGPFLRGPDDGGRGRIVPIKASVGQDAVMDGAQGLIFVIALAIMGRGAIDQAQDQTAIFQTARQARGSRPMHANNGHRPQGHKIRHRAPSSKTNSPTIAKEKGEGKALP